MSTVDNRFPTEGTQVDILAALLQIKSAIQGDVNWSQVLSSGTTIATITIGENSYIVYAPTPPTKTSDITNDSGFITNTVNNLVNYYLKTDTYTKTEVNNLISALTIINIEVVQTLPTTDISTSTIYLVPKSTAQTSNVYDEYINTDGTTAGWEKIGDTEIDLSNYYTKTQTDTLLNGKVDTVAGMGLSHNDFTDTEKTKLSGIESGAEVNVQSDWSQADSSADDYIKNKPSNLVSDASYVHTDNNFTTAEKTKLSGIESGAEVNVQSDWNQTDNTEDDYIKNKPSSEVKSATDTFTTVNGGLLEECNIELESVQDLHGYSEPWVGGAGKNKLQNTSSSTSVRGIDYTINADGTVDANGTSIQNGGIIVFNGSLPNGNYILNGSENGSASTYTIRYNINGGTNINVYSGDSEIIALTDTDVLNVQIRVYQGATLNHVLFKPMIRLSSIVDDTFEPYSNICSISGHTEVDLQVDGKNLCSGIEQGSWSTSGTKNTSNTRVRSKDFIYVEEGEKYTISKTSANTLQIYIHFFKSDKTTLVSSVSWSGLPSVITVPATASYIVFLIRFSNDANITPSDVGDIQVEKGNQPTAYEPYLGHLYQVQIGSTVYGGYVDLVSGVGKITDADNDLSSLTWTMNTSGAYPIFEASYDSSFIVADATYDGLKSSNYTPVAPMYRSGFAGTDKNGCIGLRIGNRVLQVQDNRYNTADAFSQALNNEKVTFALATPSPIQLTPQQIETLVGQNNLSTPLDGQSIDSVKYREVFVFDDVEKVVSLRVPISMLGTDESGRTTASQAYASGDYFYKDGYMCKALTSISAGATLTLNTNYSQGTLADILKAIENA